AAGRGLGRAVPRPATAERSIRRRGAARRRATLRPPYRARRGARRDREALDRAALGGATDPRARPPRRAGARLIAPARPRRRRAPPARALLRRRERCGPRASGCRARLRAADSRRRVAG